MSARAATRFFPPELVVAVKAIACELPAQLGLPPSRLHIPDIRAEVIRRGLVADISGATIWQWLSDDAIRPWRHRSWIFPRDPAFEAKAGRVLELYARRFSILQRKVLTPNDSASLIELGERILAFQEEYGNIATPFEWKFTRDDLAGLLRRLAARPEAA